MPKSTGNKKKAGKGSKGLANPPAAPAVLVVAPVAPANLATEPSHSRRPIIRENAFAWAPGTTSAATLQSLRPVPPLKRTILPSQGEEEEEVSTENDDDQDSNAPEDDDEPDNGDEDSDDEQPGDDDDSNSLGMGPNGEEDILTNKKQATVQQKKQHVKKGQATLVVATASSPSTPNSRKRPAATIGPENDVLTDHQTKRHKKNKSTSSASSSTGQWGTPLETGSSGPTGSSGLTKSSGPTGTPAPSKLATQQGSYSPPTQKVLGYAKTYFKLRISLGNLFPSAVQKQEYARQSLDQAQRKTGSQFHGTTAHYKMLTDIAPSFRSTIKLEAMALVKAQYGFQNTSGSLQAHVALLLKDDNFIYKKIKGNTPVSPFEHPCILEVIASGWFDGSDALANWDQHLFEPIPYELIAFACTVISCAIQQWSTGIYVGIQMAQPKFNPIYHRMIDHLRDYQVAKHLHCNAMQKNLTSALMKRGGFEKAKIALNYASDSDGSDGGAGLGAPSRQTGLSLDVFASGPE